MALGGDLAAATFREKEKLDKWKQQSQLVDFSPFVIEALGGFGKMTWKEVQRISQQLSAKLFITPQEAACRIYSGLSVSLQKSNGKMISLRMLSS